MTTPASSMEDRLSLRRRTFKKSGGNTEESRRAREDETIQIRKKDKEAQLLAQRRRVGRSTGNSVESEDDGMVDGGGQDIAFPALSDQSAAANPNWPSLEKLQKLYTQITVPTSREDQIASLLAIRKLLSHADAPPIQPVISAGFVPVLVEFLKTADPQAQFEAAWALTNIASGSHDQTRTVVDAGTLPLFVNLLYSPSVEVVDQAVWALGNISGDGPVLRDALLGMKVVPRLVQIIQEAQKQVMVRNAVWCLGNLCRGKPAAEFEKISPALPAFVNIVLNSDDNEAKVDALWAISYLSDGAEDRIQSVIDSGVFKYLIQDILGQRTPGLFSALAGPALRVVGNIVTGDDKQTQMALDCGLCNVLLPLLNHSKKNLRKDAAWTISNITAGTYTQIQAILDSGCFPRLIELMRMGDLTVKKEAAWAVANACSEGSTDQVSRLVALDVIPALCDLLRISDTTIVSVALDALKAVLEAGKDLMSRNSNIVDNPYCVLIEEAGGLGTIESLQNDAVEEIYLKSVEIIERYFGEAMGSPSFNDNQNGEAGFHFG